MLFHFPAETGKKWLGNRAYDPTWRPIRSEFCLNQEIELYAAVLPIFLAQIRDNL